MKILIIGGGFAGWHLLRYCPILKNCKITLVEKSSDLGAGVRTYFYGGHPYTYGPRHFITTRKEAYNYIKKFLKNEKL